MFCSQIPRLSLIGKPGQSAVLHADPELATGPESASRMENVLTVWKMIVNVTSRSLWEDSALQNSVKNSFI